MLPQDSGYDQARKVWNGMIDRHPAIITRCSDAGDVIHAVNFARKNNLLVAVRGGAHNVAGFGTCDNGIVIDLSMMKKIDVDPERKTARAEPGLTWGEFDKATQVHGLAVTGGLISTTGIAGFTLGGGVGWLVRRIGLTLDNLISVDVVTAEGRLVKASLHENPDLFWGIRGGGGNFGIVTSFTYSLASVGPMVFGGMVLYPLETGTKILAQYRKFVEKTPDELTTMAALITAPPAPFIPQEFQGKKVVAILGCYSGSDLEEGKRLMDPVRRLDEKRADLLQPLPYLALQSMMDAAAPAGVQNYWKSSYLPDLTEEAVETILAAFESVPSPMTAVHLHQLGGAMRRVGDDATAFGHRGAAYIMNLVSTWLDPSQSEKNVNWTRETFAAMEQFSHGGVYVNFLSEGEGRQRIVSAYGDAKYSRLARLKAKYDPDNLFRVNQNILPEHNK